MPMSRPTGSNADEWRLFLSEHLDTRATEVDGLSFVAVQIAEALDGAAQGEPFVKPRTPNADAQTAWRQVMCVLRMLEDMTVAGARVRLTRSKVFPGVDHADLMARAVNTMVRNILRNAEVVEDA